MSFDILVLHSDRSTGMNFVQCLQEAKRQGWGKDINIIGLSSHPLRMQLCKNDATYLFDEDDTDIVKHVGRIEKDIGKPIDLVYETKSAVYMLDISKLRNRLPVFLPPHELVEVFEDKFLTYKHLSERGLPVPETHLVNSPEDVEAAFRSIAKNAVWVRETKGQAGLGAFSASTPKEVIGELTQRNGWRHHTVAEKLPINTPNTWEDQLSSDFFPGEMVTWAALYNNGQLIGSQVRKRLYWEHADLTVSGVTGYSGANMTVSRRDVHDLSDKIVRSFDWKPHGAVGIDYVADENGKIKLTEIQASRFYTSTYPLALLGLNLPKLYIDVFRGKETCNDAINPCPEGMIYIQRFGAESVMIHRDTILSELSSGTSRPKFAAGSLGNSSHGPLKHEF
ncbi:MAG: hypothetical protein PHW76_02705 [Alphaproteobacteria bacterium]|nr:hypothetical protein [Alphaproteobacteria bacterium]